MPKQLLLLVKFNLILVNHNISYLTVILCSFNAKSFQWIAQHVWKCPQKADDAPQIDLHGYMASVIYDRFISASSVFCLQKYISLFTGQYALRKCIFVTSCRYIPQWTLASWANQTPLLCWYWKSLQMLSSYEERLRMPKIDLIQKSVCESRSY